MVSLTEQAARLHRWRALVVDDEADSRDALAILLTWTGYEVQVASEAAGALEAAARFRPHLILLDIGMPDVNGYAICRALRTAATSCDARIYAISGFSGPAHEACCKQAGFTGQYTKPLDPAVLIILG
jgi:two-component system, chemotaxis family, CheB/CheR fusion protein